MFVQHCKAFSAKVLLFSCFSGVNLLFCQFLSFHCVIADLFGILFCAIINFTTVSQTKEYAITLLQAEIILSKDT